MTAPFHGLGKILLAVSAGVWVAWLANARVHAPTDLSQSDLLRRASSPWAEARALRVATYNIADGYLFTTNREERMRAIADELVRLDPDVVGLQEAFIKRDRDLLWARLGKSRLRYEVRFPGALVGNGLWILSAYPIEESWFHRYSHSNPWYSISEGDYWAGKGVGLARLALPGGDLIDIYNTHAQAGRGNPDNELVRDGQMKELAQFVRSSRTPDAPAVILGDFNTRPGAPDYERVVRETPLVRVMKLPSEIDHIFAVEDAHYRFEPVETLEIRGRIQGSHAGLFLSRAPTLSEWWQMNWGPPSVTELSDHPGYLVALRIQPRLDETTSTGSRAGSLAQRDHAALDSR